MINDINFQIIISACGLAILLTVAINWTYSVQS